MLRIFLSKEKDGVNQQNTKKQEIDNTLLSS